jgi:heme oxygenase
MSELRAATGGQHAELEKAVAIEDRFRSPEAYRELLEIFYGFVRPIESLLSAHDWAGVGLNFLERAKSSLLEKDLKVAGSAAVMVEKCESMPDVSTIDRAFGALYVMEGSTLGGQQISRMARQAKISPDALTYFRSYGERVGEMWKSFGEALNRFAESRGDASEIIHGAQDTFDALRAWFLCRLAVS